MKFLNLIWANLMRRKARTLFTLLSVLVAFVLYGVLGAVRHAFTGGVELAGADRLVTMNRIGLIESMPINYAERIAKIPGVAEVSWQEWVGGYFQDPRQPITAFAVDGDSYLDIHPDMHVPPAASEAWLKDRRGVLIGAAVARKYGWKTGDHFPLRSNIWRDTHGNTTWDVNVDGVYTGAQDDMLLMHYKYLDDARAFRREQVGMFILKIADPDHAGEIAENVDQMFANSDAETKTSTEKAFLQGFAAQLGNIADIVTGIVIAVLFSMLLVTANTMAQSIRERTPELAVLKALGFTHRGVAVMVLAESLLITLSGGAIGLLLAYVAARGIGTHLQFLTDFNLPVSSIITGFLYMILLGALAGLLPAMKASRLQVAAALRRV